MPTTDAIKRRLDTADDLRSIVRTMKALAAANIRQFEEAVVSLEDYRRTVDYGFQILLRTRPGMLRRPPPPAPQRLGAIVLGSDYGLCGAFNEQIAAFYLQRRQGVEGRVDRLAAGVRTETAPLMAIGLRAAGRLEDLGRPPAAVLTLPASAVGIAALVRDVLGTIAAWRDAGAVDGVRLYFNAPRGQAGYTPQEELLLPVDEERLRRLAAEPWRPRATPAIAGDWDALFTAVVGQHLFVALHRAMALSLASENASRLAAMHTAERNIDERLHMLRGQYHRERQSSITTELLDIVSGYEALTRGSRRARPATSRELP